MKWMLFCCSTNRYWWNSKMTFISYNYITEYMTKTYLTFYKMAFRKGFAVWQKFYFSSRQVIWSDIRCLDWIFPEPRLQTTYIKPYYLSGAEIMYNIRGTRPSRDTQHLECHLIYKVWIGVHTNIPNKEHFLFLYISVIISRHTVLKHSTPPYTVSYSPQWMCSYRRWFSYQRCSSGSVVRIIWKAVL